MTLIGYSGSPSQSIDFDENSSDFQRKKDGGSAWYKSPPKRELPPRDRRLQSSSFQVFMKIPMRRRSNKRPLSFQIEMFFSSSQDERTCNFCWTDFATDWGELIKKWFPWCTLNVHEIFDNYMHIHYKNFFWPPWTRKRGYEWFLLTQKRDLLAFLQTLITAFNNLLSRKNGSKNETCFCCRSRLSFGKRRWRRRFSWSTPSSGSWRLTRS